MWLRSPSLGGPSFGRIRGRRRIPRERHCFLQGTACDGNIKELSDQCRGYTWMASCRLPLTFSYKMFINIESQRRPVASWLLGL